jgi:Tfp pilus assembly protein PilX
MDAKIGLKDQSGTALVVALIMIVVLTLIGLASTFSSTFEISLSGNKRTSTDAFYLAETRNNTAARRAAAFDDQAKAGTSPFTYTPVSDDTQLTSSETHSGLDGEDINRRTVINPNQLGLLALPSGKSLNDNTTLTLYHSRVAGGGGEGTQSMRSDTYIIDTLGTDQIISANQYKSTVHLRTKVMVRRPTIEESQ